MPKGVMSATDAEIIADLRAGKTLRQINKKRMAGLRRIRRLNRRVNPDA